MSENKEDWLPKEKTWKDFYETGLLWWVNRILHLFGWAIVFEFDDEDETKIISVYPARVKYRGFCHEVEEKNFIKLSKYLKENIDELDKEANL
jgi:hypothetical protein